MTLVLPWTDGEDVAHGVDGCGAAEGFCSFDEPVSGFLVGV